MQLKNYGHLTYCTNIHPGENWKTTFESLKSYVPKIKKSVSPREQFGLGLRLSNVASAELDKENNLVTFKNWLDSNGLYVFTMNGFPYGNFHKERVKDDVHTPDWTTDLRLAYTQRLFKQLAFLIPDGMDGGLSTSPISYKHWYTSEAAKTKAFEEGAQRMVQVALQLFELEKSTGKYLHLDIEPEPDGLLENSDEVLDFFKNYLVPIGAAQFAAQGITAGKAIALIKRYLTVCYDVCHFALAFEEPQATFAKFKANAIKIGKIQVSAALKILYKKNRINAIWSSLEQFDEPTYLHQVTAVSGDKVITYPDLPSVLEGKQGFSEMRAHFHVPIFLEKFNPLYSTQDHILKVVDILKDQRISNHLEIETYTWEVLPQQLKLELSASIIREINWFKSALQ